MPAEWLTAASACLLRCLVLHCYKWPHIAAKQDGKKSKAESSLGGLRELFESWCQLVAMVSHSSSLTLLGSTILLYTENCAVSIALIHCKQSPRSIKNPTTSFLKADTSTSASWSNSKLSIYIYIGAIPPAFPVELPVLHLPSNAAMSCCTKLLSPFCTLPWVSIHLCSAWKHCCMAYTAVMLHRLQSYSQSFVFRMMV